jgi:uncharacterized protein YkwD
MKGWYYMKQLLAISLCLILAFGLIAGHASELRLLTPAYLGTGTGSDAAEGVATPEIDPYTAISMGSGFLTAMPVLAFVKPGKSPSSTAAADGELDHEVVEDELLRLINESRADGSVTELERNDIIRSAARIRALELHKENSHTRPNGKTYYTAFDDVGFAYNGKWHGENAATVTFTEREPKTETETAKALFDVLNESAGNAKNMLRSQYKQAGVGVSVKEENGTVTVTSAQLFTS